MPRLIRYTTSGVVPKEVPDQALAVIEHATLFYLIERQFKGVNKYVAFAVAGAGYEIIIDQLKRQNPEQVRSETIN